MSKIPTAEEFFKSSIPKYESVSELMTDGDIFYHAKEFAKLHVEAALEAAANEYYPRDKANFELVTERFINAYPLTNIK